MLPACVIILYPVSNSTRPESLSVPQFTLSYLKKNTFIYLVHVYVHCSMHVDVRDNLGDLAPLLPYGSQELT